MASAFLTVPEVARLLRVGQRTIYTLARSGSLAGAVKVGNQWRVNKIALGRWAGRVPGSPTEVSARSPRPSRRARGRA